LTGTAGVAGFVIFLAALPLYFAGPQPMGRLEKALQFAASVREARNLILARATVADPLIMACLLAFLAGFVNLIRKARPDLAWVSDLVWGAGVVVIALELAGDALDTSVKANPTVVRGLWEGSIVFYGVIGLILSALLLAAAAYATLATGLLPRWVGRLALVCAAVNLAAAPSIFGGTNVTSFYSANGYVTFLAQGALLLWFFIASVALIVGTGEAPAAK
jgi:hypothetical protein